MKALEVKNLCKTFSVGGLLHASGREKHAVVDVSFGLEAGETLSIVGESGSGKSTTARVAMRLLAPSAGQVFWNGEDVSALGGVALRRRRSHIQMVFQDPFASLNPRMRIWQSVAEGLRVHQPELSRRQRRDRVAEMLEQCGLDASGLDRYPHQFSGGQRQRIGIARALVVEPKVLVLDEPVSALDVSVQAQILNLLKELQVAKRLAYLFISHDLSVIRHVTDRVAVMFAGHVVETGMAAEIFEHPRHPYTQALLQARPISHPKERLQVGEVGEVCEETADNGCVYRLRCPHAQTDCAQFAGQLNEQGYACLHPLSRSVDA